MRSLVACGALPALLAAMPALAALAADAARGREVFKVCIACHGDTGDQGSLGPSLKGVVGRPAGTREDFRYSSAIQRSGIIWDEANLKDYITNPQAKVKGNRMPFTGLANPSDAEDVIAFLKTMN